MKQITISILILLFLLTCAAISLGMLVALPLACHHLFGPVSILPAIVLAIFLSTKTLQFSNHTFLNWQAKSPLNTEN